MKDILKSNEADLLVALQDMVDAYSYQLSNERFNELLSKAPKSEVLDESDWQLIRRVAKDRAQEVLAKAKSK